MGVAFFRNAVQIYPKPFTITPHPSSLFACLAEGREGRGGMREKGGIYEQSRTDYEGF